jgi:hypothetical protein
LGDRSQHNIRRREKREPRLAVNLRDPKTAKVELVSELRLFEKFA